MSGKYKAKSVNEAVDRVFKFDRNWASFHFPQLIMVIDKIQRFLFNVSNMKPGNYSYYSTQVESLFLSPIFSPIEEFGVPSIVLNKIPNLGRTDDLEKGLDIIRNLNVDVLKLHEYEKIFIKNMQKYI